MILGVSGKIKSGKNEFYNHLQSLMERDNIESVDFSYGVIIKRLSAMIFGIEYDPSKDREYKEEIFVDLSNFKTYTRDEVMLDLANIDYLYDSEYIDDFIGYWGVRLSDLINNIGNHKKPRVLITMRIWLQYFGTNVCREFVNDFWINSTFNSLDLTKNLICTDVRFPNEASAIINRGGIVIRIEREECNNRDNEHISESAMDSYNEYDYVIHNNGTLEDFHSEIRAFYESVKDKFIR